MPLVYKRIFAVIVDLLIVKICVDFLIKNDVLHSVSYEINFFYKEFIVNYSNGWIILICYFLFFDLINNGKTIGKLIFSISLQSKEGSLKSNNLMLRSFYKLFSFAILPVTLLIFLAKNKFILHDYRSSVIVVDEK